MRRTRSVATTILVILASLGVVLSLVGAWVKTTLFDTDSFVQVVDSSLTSEEIVTVISDVVSEQAILALDIEGRLETRLGAIDTYLSDSLADALDLGPAQRALLSRIDLPQFASLAGPIAEPIERRIEESVDGLVASDGFQEVLPEAIAFAHRGAVALIRDDIDALENVSIVAGEVQWNILPLVERAIGHVFSEGILDSVVDSLNLSVATYVGVREDALAKLGEALGTVLPDDFGQVTVMSEERLETWQGLARTLDRIAMLAIILTVALLVAALVVSHNKRRTLVQFAAGSVIALVVAAIVQRNVLEALNEAIPGPPEQAAATVLFDALFTNLRTVAWVFVIFAALVGVSAYLAGRPAWLEGLRSEAPGAGIVTKVTPLVRANQDAFSAGGIAVALLIWWIVGLSTVSFFLVGFLLGGYLWWVAKLAHPDAVPAVDQS
ncbi:MAG: hypothetical protein QNJ75_02030 [Acidimicrobiia bacterium]|nr:hypothetical protein [Acidimicrobiia bacterium]